MENDNKTITQVPTNELLAVKDWILKCLPPGRPSVEDTPELQREYTAIYIDKVVKGMSDEVIATARNISQGKVKNAVKWCRNANSCCSSIERLVDAVNSLNFRLQDLVNAQERLKRMLADEYKILASLPITEKTDHLDSLRKIDAFNKLILLQEDRILAVLQRKFTLETLIGNQLPTTDDEEPAEQQKKLIKEFFHAVISMGFSTDDFKTIWGIMHKTAIGKNKPTETKPDL